MTRTDSAERRTPVAVPPIPLRGGPGQPPRVLRLRAALVTSRLASRQGLVSLSVLLLVWAVAGLVVDPIYLPSIADVVRAGVEVMDKGILPTYFAESLFHVSVACVIGIALGVPMGLLIGMNRWIAGFFLPLLNFFQALSGIAWLPMIVIWTGYTDRAILIAINYAVVFPVVFNTVVGVRRVPRRYIQAFRTMGGGEWRLARDVILPGALPSIITGIRLGVAFGWRAMIGAELVVAIGGLGFMMFEAKTTRDIARIVLGMLIIGGCWLIVDSHLLRPLERSTIRRWGMVSDD